MEWDFEEPKAIAYRVFLNPKIDLVNSLRRLLSLEFTEKEKSKKMPVEVTLEIRGT